MTKSEGQKSVVVAMSGGVDSSVCASIMKKKGFKVSGVFMALAQPDLNEQIARVRHIADFLKIPIEVVDLSDKFKKAVLEYFTNSYLEGKTPNPCIICNRTIKFGKLMDHCLTTASYMATGHYARTSFDQDGSVQLIRGRDPKKDQSYFLCKLSQQQLSRIHFPLGNITKKEVYEIAAELGINKMHSSESQDICFMQNKSLGDFFKSENPKIIEGKIITESGEIKGVHTGIHKYTVGQRKGLGIPDKTPYYVTRIDAAHNQIIIGKENDLWRNWLEIKDINWISGKEPALPQNLLVKIRYRHVAAPAVVEKTQGNIRIIFEQPQRAITPGQFAVLYDDHRVVGGGEIR